MDLVKAWGVAIVAYLLTNLVFGFVVVSAADPDQLRTGATHYLWTLLPGIVIYFLTTLLANIFHGVGHGTGRHLLAVFTVPVIGLLISLVGSMMSGSTVGDEVLSLLAAIVGMLAGWQLVDRLRKERDKTITDSYW